MSPLDEDAQPGRGRVRVDATVVHGTPDGWFLPGNGQGEWFKDHAAGPEMVVIPAGAFTMGSPASEQRWAGYDGREEPKRRVEIARPFAVSATPITRQQFAAFVAATGTVIPSGAYIWTGKRWWLWWMKEWRLDPRSTWVNPGYAQGPDHPVVCVSWDDTKAYVAWLNEICATTRYRLLTEAEWEYCCRAGTTTAYHTGDAITAEQANLGRPKQATSPVRTYPANAWGLSDMHGNVWEWVEDHWHKSYAGDPPCDGSAWSGGDHVLHGLRGGNWDYGTVHCRSADRGRCPHDLRNYVVGFRIARDID